MYTHGIHTLFSFRAHVVPKITMSRDLAQVNPRCDKRFRLTCPACGGTRGRPIRS